MSLPRFKTWKPRVRSGGAANWREPAAAEAKAYAITDGADTPPALATIDIIAVGYEGTRVALAGNFRRDVVPFIENGKDYMIAALDDVDFTPAAAWARYVERQESIIEDLKRETETREKWRAFALAEHVKVGPSGPPPHRHEFKKSEDGARRTCHCGESHPRCRLCGGNRDTCGHFVGAGAL